VTITAPGSHEALGSTTGRPIVGWRDRQAGVRSASCRDIFLHLLCSPVPELRVRKMTAIEFARFRDRAIKEYAASHVRAGDWPAETAAESAAKETDDLLPDGVDTAGMLLLVAERANGDVVGSVWIALQRPGIQGAWIYDIEIEAEHRGQGFGRMLLEAAELEMQRRGAESVALNVFGANAPARRLYESAGYDVASLQMRKVLTSIDNA
jgi:ribosomal protein S18 acetylase RimI-like enzyme